MWKERAEALFFIEHNSINQIAQSVGKQRETISRYLSKLPLYNEEKLFRMKQNKEKRKAYQRQWDKDNRPNRYCTIDGDSLRHEHDLAAVILSREMRY